MGSLETGDECISPFWRLWPEALVCVLPSATFYFFYPTVQVKKCQLMRTSALHKNCPGQTAPPAPRIQLTQLWAEGQDTRMALQVSRAHGSQPAAQLMGSCQFKGLFSILSCDRFPKRVISQGKALQPFLGMWEGQWLWLLSLKQGKHTQERKQMVLLKLFAFMFVPCCYY